MPRSRKGTWRAKVLKGEREKELEQKESASCREMAS
jgi:hypothetical protein